MRKYGKPDPYYLSKEWRKLRMAVLERDGHKCVVCGYPAAIVDHIITRKKGGADAPGNLRSLCVTCDGQAKERPNGSRGKFKTIGCGPDGWPLSRSETEGRRRAARREQGISARDDRLSRTGRRRLRDVH